MGKADTKSHRRRNHTTSKRKTASKVYGISRGNMRAVEKLFAENARAASAAPEAPKSRQSVLKHLLREARRRGKTFKVKRNLGERAKSIASAPSSPVAQVKALGSMIRKHEGYLLRKHTNARTNNDKAMLSVAQDNYDIAVASIQEYLISQLIEVRKEYINTGTLGEVPEYIREESPYDDIENMTEYLVDFETLIQRNAPQIHTAYITIMRQIVAEMTRVINASLESAGEKKANNVNELAALFSGL
jgi:hypothetical protein